MSTHVPASFCHRLLRMWTVSDWAMPHWIAEFCARCANGRMCLRVQHRRKQPVDVCLREQILHSEHQRHYYPSVVESTAVMRHWIRCTDERNDRRIGGRRLCGWADPPMLNVLWGYLAESAHPVDRKQCAPENTLLLSHRIIAGYPQNEQPNQQHQRTNDAALYQPPLATADPPIDDPRNAIPSAPAVQPPPSSLQHRLSYFIMHLWWRKYSQILGNINATVINVWTLVLHMW